jgi:hypothetical protein
MTEQRNPARPLQRTGREQEPFLLTTHKPPLHEQVRHASAGNAAKNRLPDAEKRPRTWPPRDEHLASPASAGARFKRERLECAGIPCDAGVAVVLGTG